METVTVDLSAFDVRGTAQDGVDMVLLDPMGNATNVTLRVRGGDCKAFADMLKEQTRRQVDRGQRKATDAEKTGEFYELYATLVAGWFVNGAPAKVMFWRNPDKSPAPAIEYTPANAAQLLQNAPYIFDQVRRFADKRENFLPGSASS